MIYHQTTFNVSSLNGSLVFATTSKAKYRLQTAAMLFLYFL